MLIRIILLTLLPIFSTAQTRQEFWSRLTISKKIDEKWNLGGDVQYRSQENYHLPNNQRFENDLLQSIRLTAFYKVSEKHKLSLIASPIVYFRSFDINSEGNSTDQREYRWVVGIMQQYTILKKIHLRNRLQYEMRFLRIDSPNMTLQHRPRWQLQATIPLWKINQNFRINYLVFDELVEVESPKIKPEPNVEKLVEEAEEKFKKDLREIIGYSTIPLYRYFVIENPIDTMILNALSWNFPEIDIVLSNGFRFCPPLATKDHTGNIPITSSYLFDMFPVDSNAKTAKVTGEQIKNWLETELNNVFAKNAHERFGGWVVKFKGMKVKFYAFGEKGKRVQEITIKGKPIDLQKTYTIMACERDGDPADILCRIKGVSEPRILPKTLHQIMRDYLKKNSPVTPKPEKNAIALDAPDTLLTQVTGVDYTFR